VDIKTIELVKLLCDKSDIVSVIGKYIKLKKKGNDYVGVCPFHPDKNPSLSVSPKRKI
jgi:DNA primase